MGQLYRFNEEIFDVKQIKLGILVDKRL